MATNQEAVHKDGTEKPNQKVYIEVGFMTRTHDTVIHDRETYGRKIILVYDGTKERLLAEYDRSEFCESDWEVFARHPLNDAVLGSTKEPMKYYDFTRGHFIETLRADKARICDRLGLKMDGTIFGRLSRVVHLPARFVLVPAQDNEIFVEYDCWEDSWTASDSLDESFQYTQ